MVLACSAASRDMNLGRRATCTASPRISRGASDVMLMYLLNERNQLG